MSPHPNNVKNSPNQLNAKKIAWQENGKRQVQLNIPKIVMGGLIGTTQKHERKNKRIVRSKQLRDKSRIQKMHQRET